MATRPVETVAIRAFIKAVFPELGGPSMTMNAGSEDDKVFSYFISISLPQKGTCIYVSCKRKA